MSRRSRGWKVGVAPNGKNWRCRWRGKYGAGQQVFVYKSDAEKFRESKVRDFQHYDAGLPPTPRQPEPRTVGWVADEYLAYSKREKAPGTHNRFDKPAIASLRAFLGDNRLLLDVSPSDVQGWKHSLPATGTALILYRQAVAYFNYAVSMKYLSESPAKGLKKPPEGDTGRDLTDAEIRGILDGAPEPLFKTGTFALNTILRIGEICGKNGLRWEWVTELENGSWCGRYPAKLRKGRSKVKKDLVFLINGKARAVMGERKKTGPVFPWSPNTIQQLIVKQRTDKGLADDITFHCFRHTGATRYLRLNGHMEDLISTGLWKDARSLMRYIHLDLGTLSGRFNDLGDSLPAQQGPKMREPQGRRPQGS